MKNSTKPEINLKKLKRNTNNFKFQKRNPLLNSRLKKMLCSNKLESSKQLLLSQKITHLKFLSQTMWQLKKVIVQDVIQWDAMSKLSYKPQIKLTVKLQISKEISSKSKKICFFVISMHSMKKRLSQRPFKIYTGSMKRMQISKVNSKPKKKA